MDIEDWEHEARKDLTYLEEDMFEFYQSLNTGKIHSVEPATIVVKWKKQLPINHEHQINSIPFQRASTIRF